MQGAAPKKNNLAWVRAPVPFEGLTGPKPDPVPPLLKLRALFARTAPPSVLAHRVELVPKVLQALAQIPVDWGKLLTLDAHGGRKSRSFLEACRHSDALLHEVRSLFKSQKSLCLGAW